MIILWAGSECLTRVLLRLPVPSAFPKALGFALRVAPVLNAEVEAYRRNRQMLRLASGRKPRFELGFAIGEIFSQTVDSIDKMVLQVEERGYHGNIFGRDEQFEFHTTNVVVLACAVTSTLLVLLTRF
jgi:energy-coupling factor transporter transmembrane protein EcfT